MGTYRTSACSFAFPGTVIAIWLEGGVFPLARFASAWEAPGEGGRFDMTFG